MCIRDRASIAVRAAQLVKPGGTLVYSTCSLNPVEDEAVVAELLRADPSLTVIEDPRAPQLIRRPGLTTWKVLDEGDDGLVEYASPDDVPEGKARRFRPSVFPPTDSRIKAQLTRCMRFLPHDADAGDLGALGVRLERAQLALHLQTSTVTTLKSEKRMTSTMIASATCTGRIICEWWRRATTTARGGRRLARRRRRRRSSCEFERCNL